MFEDPTTMTGGRAVRPGRRRRPDQPYAGAQQLQADRSSCWRHFGGPVQMIEMNTTDPSFRVE